MKVTLVPFNRDVWVKGCVRWPAELTKQKSCNLSAGNGNGSIIKTIFAFWPLWGHSLKIFEVRPSGCNLEAKSFNLTPQTSSKVPYLSQFLATILPFKYRYSSSYTQKTSLSHSSWEADSGKEEPAVVEVHIYGTKTFHSQRSSLSFMVSFLLMRLGWDLCL